MEANDPQHATATATLEDTATYIVQVPISGGAWEDIPVEVARRSKTRTVLLAGLKKAGIKPAQALAEGTRFRVLNEAQAVTHGLKAREPREPELELD